VSQTSRRRRPVASGGIDGGWIREVGAPPSIDDGLETRRWNRTKSAFADYAAATVQVAAIMWDVLRRADRMRSRTNAGDESAKADFVPFQPGVFNPGLFGNHNATVDFRHGSCYPSR